MLIVVVAASGGPSDDTDSEHSNQQASEQPSSSDDQTANESSDNESPDSQPASNNASTSNAHTAIADTPSERARVETTFTDLNVTVVDIDDSGVTFRFSSTDGENWLANVTSTYVTFADGTSYSPTYGKNALDIRSSQIDEAGSGNLVTVQNEQPADIKISNSNYTNADEYNGMQLKFNEEWFLNGTKNSEYKDCTATISW